MIRFWKNNQALLVTLIVTIAFFALVTQVLELRVTVSILLSGLTLGAITFLVASGLSLIFGLMDVLNFAHGAIFVFGAYVGLSAFENPRLLFNTLPFILALSASTYLAVNFGDRLWRRVSAKELQRALWLLSLALSLGLLAFALRRFPITALNAFDVTAVGGAVSTSQAQEPMGLMVQRVLVVFLAGFPLGLALAPKESAEEARRRPGWRVIAYALALLILGYVILWVRDPGESLWLGLPVDARFALAILFAALAGVLIGIVIETTLIRPFYGSPVTQLVLTLGLSIVAIDLIELVWGQEGHPPMQPPTLFTGACRSESLLAWFSEGCRSIDVLGRAFPTYRLFIILTGVLVFTGVGLLLKRSRLGMIIRAGVQDSEMVQALGINVRQVFTFVFALGSAMAALGGVIVAPFLGVFPEMGAIFLLQAFIAVVIGGMGSYAGAAVGTILLGLARAFGDHFVAVGIDLPFLATTLKGSPAMARASTVLLMAIVLLVRPAGIFGKKE
ncbi:MAG TPA: branched-chain amino acid ABC transporter permease [Anaerolineales bacterium]